MVNILLLFILSQFQGRKKKKANFFFSGCECVCVCKCWFVWFVSVFTFSKLKIGWATVELCLFYWYGPHLRQHFFIVYSGSSFSSKSTQKHEKCINIFFLPIFVYNINICYSSIAMLRCTNTQIWKCKCMYFFPADDNRWWRRWRRFIRQRFIFLCVF